MKLLKPLVLLLMLCWQLNANAQSNQRIPVTTVTDPSFPNWDYSAWLTDSLNVMVPQVWGHQVYSDVIVTLSAKSIVSKISLYDYTGVYDTNPAYVYAINGADTTYIGKFTGDQYQVFKDYNIGFPLVAGKIAIRKYANNIPQKVQVYGVPYQAGSTADAAPMRLTVDTIIPAINTGMNYKPWLNDTLTSLVASAWGSINNQYVDVKLRLSGRSQVTKISLYDHAGVCTSNPAYIYTLKDTTMKLIGMFDGQQYMQFVNYLIPEGLQADAVIIRKYANYIPQKVQVYGRLLPADPFTNTIAPPAPPAPPEAGPLPTPVDTTPAPVYTKIPIEANRWYILNYAPNGIGVLFNGVTNENVSTGYASYIPTYDCIYPLNDGESITLNQIKMFDYNGTFSATPAQLYAIKKDGSRVNLGSFNGSKYNQWVGPYPDRNTTGAAMFNLDSTISNIQYIGIRCYQNCLPTEIEFYGAYTAPPIPAIPPRVYANFSKTLGMNGFEWDFVNPFTNSRIIDESKYAAIKNFRGFRHYLDWKQMEGTEGKFRFNPSTAGGWNYDMTYERCKRDSIEVLVCIKNTPDWMRDSYPEAIRATDNAPLMYGNSRDSVRSYIEKGRMAFQFTARYGRNANIPDSLLKVNTQPRWTADPPNTVKVGLGLVKYIECGNELDKWWRGINGYMNAYDYATLLSVFYDGHKGTLGKDVGVKTADSTMQVVMSGLAFNDPSYVRGMIEWCRQNRGYRADGKVNLCWDVINYHHYSNDAAQSQQATSTRGAAPEVSDAISDAKAFVNFAEKYAYGMPVWITELGFDVNQSSPLKAIAIGNKSVLETQADWTLRSSLTYLREGISSLFFYELKDYNINSTSKFGSMGLTDTLHKRKPAMDYLFQANQLIGNYHFNRSLQQLPTVDEYENEGKFMYAVWVPDEKGTTLTCSLPFPSADSAVIYRMVIGSDLPSAETVPVVNGTVQLTATETPVFVAAKPSSMVYVFMNRQKKFNTQIPVVKP